MKTILHSLVVGSLLVVPVAGLAQTAEREIPRTAGKVLVLDNDRIMEGDIVREGDRYRIKRHAGETWVPAQRVRMVCDSLEEVYRGMRNRANLRDVDELLKLARWCRQHRLREQGLKDAQAILQIRPGHAEGLRLLRHFQKAVDEPTELTPVAHRETDPPAPSSFGLTLESLGLFAGRVQPILMNTCANCHTASHNGPFKLVRAYSDGSTNRKAIQQNIAAVMGQINPDPDHWPSSPFLLKAVSIHGESPKPPLKGRNTPAYAMLEEWVHLAVSEMPRPAVAAKANSEPPAPLSERTVFAATALPQPRDPARPELPAPKPAGKEPTPQPVGPVDPFDPVIFNQQSGRER